MTVKLNTLVLTFFVFVMALDQACGAAEKVDEKPVYPANAAHDALEVACKRAAAESKMVFVKSGYPECSWCRVFDKYHKTAEVQQIIGKYYIVVAIDTSYMPDGKTVFSALAKPGGPSWVIITPEKKVIVDSYAADENVGYPLQPEETAHYRAALKKATPAITAAELETLSQQIRQAAGKPAVQDEKK